MADSPEVYEPPRGAHVPGRQPLRTPTGIRFFVAISLLAGGAFVASLFSSLAEHRDLMDEARKHGMGESFQDAYTSGLALLFGWALSLFVVAAGLCLRQRWARPVLILAWAFPLLSQLWLLTLGRWMSLEPLMSLTAIPPVLAVWYFYLRKPVRAYYTSLK